MIDLFIHSFQGLIELWLAGWTLLSTHWEVGTLAVGISLVVLLALFGKNKLAQYGQQIEAHEQEERQDFAEFYADLSLFAQRVHGVEFEQGQAYALFVRLTGNAEVREQSALNAEQAATVLQRIEVEEVFYLPTDEGGDAA